MGDNLRWVLILISALVIGGLLIHGLWSVRKRSNESKTSQQQKQEPKPAPVYEVKSTAKDDVEPTQSSSFSAVDTDEPSFGQMNVDEADTEQAAAVDAPQHAEVDEPVEEPQNEEPPQDFIILHVHMPEGLQMQGAKLLPLVLTLGFKYSDEGFFVRHEQASGQGAPLFTMVNMYNPGTFDIDNMEQFSTAGISLFMTLPNPSDAMPTFNMLHSAAKKIAEEFGAQLLDHERQPLSVNQVREYVEKVRQYA